MVCLGFKLKVRIPPPNCAALSNLRATTLSITELIKLKQTAGLQRNQQKKISKCSNKSKLARNENAAFGDLDF